MEKKNIVSISSSSTTNPADACVFKSIPAAAFAQVELTELYGGWSKCLPACATQPPTDNGSTALWAEKKFYLPKENVGVVNKIKAIAILFSN